MKLYILIQQLLRRKFVQYFVLFFILISIIAVIASSFEEMATYKVLLFGITYVSSFIFLIEYTARIVSAPALYPGMKTAKARNIHSLFMVLLTSWQYCLVFLPMHTGIRKSFMSLFYPISSLFLS
jgi:hypothetical protein